MKKFTAAFILFLSCALVLGGCSKESGKPFEIGKWNGETFTNEWSDIKFTLPDGCTRITSEKLLSYVDGDYDADVNRTDISSEYHDYTQAVSVYDCMVYLSDGKSSLTVTYANMDSSLGKFTCDEYLLSVYNQLKTSTIIKYTLVDNYDETVGGYRYSVSEYTVNDEMTQKYYCRMIDGKIVVMITSVLNDSESEMDELLSRFERSNPEE